MFVSDLIGMCFCPFQDQAFGELEKNSDKLLQGTSSSDSSQPAHLHELLCSLQKQLLAYCHINCVTEVLEGHTRILIEAHMDLMFFIVIFNLLNEIVLGCVKYIIYENIF